MNNNFMKNIITIALLCLPFLLASQTTIPFPGFFSEITDVTNVGGGLYDVTVSVNDQSGNYNGNSIDTVDFVLWQNCGRYEIDSILLQFPSQLIVRLNDVDGSGAPINGFSSILEESPVLGVGFFISGILNSQNQCMLSYYAERLDVPGGGTEVAGVFYNFISATQTYSLPEDTLKKYPRVVIYGSIGTLELPDLDSSEDTLYNGHKIELRIGGESETTFYVRSDDSTSIITSDCIDQDYSRNGNDTIVTFKPTVVTYHLMNDDNYYRFCDEIDLYFNNQVLQNGDTIPFLDCNAERFVDPFDFSDRVVVSAVSLDTFEQLNVYVNGVYYNSSAYTISGDSLIFSSYTIQSVDEVFIEVCSGSVANPNTIDLNGVLSNGNNGGGLLIKNIGNPVDPQDAVTLSYLESVTDTVNLAGVLEKGNDGGSNQIKNIANPTDAQDAVTLSYLEANSGGDDTLYLSDGTMLVNGDTIPVFDCSSQRFFAPFAQSDRIIVASGTIDTFELINVFINGVHYEQATYTISEDSIIFNDYTLSSSDTVSLDVCSVGVGSAASTTLNAVLSNSNDGGGLVIKNIGTPVDNNDAVTKQYFENNDKWIATELPNGTISLKGNNNSLLLDSLGTVRITNTDGAVVDYEFILSPNSSIPLRIGRYEAGDTVLIDMEDFEMTLRDSSGSYKLKELAGQFNQLFYKDGVSISDGDTLSSFVKAGAIETVQNTNFTASLGVVNIVNTTSTAIEVTPPASPSIGDCFAVVDGTGNGSNNNITVDFSGSGENFHGSSQDYIMNLDNDYGEFLYVGSTVGWIRKK